MPTPEREWPEVLVITSETPVEALGDYLLGDGGMPEGSVAMTMADFQAIGRVEDCDCGLIQCCCEVARRHTKECRFRVSITCAIPIDCVHGYDSCPQCDPCTCGALP